MRTLAPAVLPCVGELERIMTLYDAQIWSRRWSG
jgi:hypothetical protein